MVHSPILRPLWLASGLLVQFFELISRNSLSCHGVIRAFLVFPSDGIQSVLVAPSLSAPITIRAVLLILPEALMVSYARLTLDLAAINRNNQQEVLELAVRQKH